MPELDRNEPWVAPRRDEAKPEGTNGPVAAPQTAAKPLDETGAGDRDRLGVTNGTCEGLPHDEPSLDRHGYKRLMHQAQRLLETLTR